MEDKQKPTEQKKRGVKPKYDYEGEKFLEMISELAKKGYTDRDIAITIGITPEEFSRKKSASQHIPQALARGRSQLNTVVRGAFLKAALGGRLVKKYSYVQKRCECGGKDPECPICDGSGWITPEQHRVVEEYEQAPNIMAQNRWLMNYDEEWKKQLKGNDPTDINKVEGIDIEVTFNKKEDLDLQQRVKKDETQNAGDSDIL